MNFPNAITLARLMSVPVGIWLLLGESYIFGFWVFVAAGLSDAVDGFIAKRFDMRTELGTILDPIADKALLVGIYVTLGAQDHLATWLVILVVFRDLMILGGALLLQLLSGRLRAAPTHVSKLNTAAQIALAATVLADLAFEIGLAVIVDSLVVIVAATTVISGAMYVFLWARQTRVDDGAEASEPDA
ncbi:MAG: CDP-alcohol phosphatidyltransferase family protein [Alphaproteobacteria bacterium]